MVHLSEKHAGFRAASPWVERWAGLVPEGTPVLDLACGGGRHGRLFLDRGHPVTFLDRDVSAVDDLRGQAGVTLIEADLEDGSPFPLKEQQFGGLVVTCYLHRPILPDLIQAVAPGGVLIYETFAIGNEVYGHPARQSFLLEEGELLDAVAGHLTVRAYEHGYEDEPKPGIRQKICATRTA